LQRELDLTGKILGLVVIAIAVVMIATLILAEHVTGIAGIADVLILGVALAVAAVPEGLPAVVTAVLSIGVQRMARRNAIVRHLAAVETLGSASIIASDKTGTLTRNEMTVRVVVTASGQVSFTGSGYAPDGEVQREGGGKVEGSLQRELERALAAADLANNATVHPGDDGRWIVEGDPTEGALLVAARKCGLDDVILDARLPRVGEVPFSSERKLMSTLHRDLERGEKLTVFSKGAPDVLLARCSSELVGENPVPLTPDRRAAIEKTNLALADQGLRTLGIAVRRLADDVRIVTEEVDQSVEQDLVFVGLIGMMDPPRAEAGEAVARAKRAGIRPIMITGDHPRTASVIARELGITADGHTMTGTDLDQQLVEQALRRGVVEREGGAVETEPDRHDDRMPPITGGRLTPASVLVDAQPMLEPCVRPTSPSCSTTWPLSPKLAASTSKAA
jgi:Ca2+-transporting ATPase